MLDDEVIEHFRARAEADGTGYQQLVNDILREAVVRAQGRNSDDMPLTVARLRKVLREELHRS